MQYKYFIRLNAIFIALFVIIALPVNAKSDTADDVVKKLTDTTLELPAIEGSHGVGNDQNNLGINACLLYTSPSPRDATLSRMPSSA